jgi:hypothetical protein
MVMTKAGSYNSPKPRISKINQDPYTAPSTPRPDKGQAMASAPRSKGIKPAGTPGGSTSHAAWDNSTDAPRPPTGTPSGLAAMD